MLSAFRTSVVLMSNFSFTNGAKTSPISKVNRNTSFSHRTLIQRNACLFLHIGSPHWWPHHSQGSSHLLQELSPAREGCPQCPNMKLLPGTHQMSGVAAPGLYPSSPKCYVHMDGKAGAVFNKHQGTVRIAVRLRGQPPCPSSALRCQKGLL